MRDTLCFLARCLVETPLTSDLAIIFVNLFEYNCLVFLCFCLPLASEVECGSLAASCPVATHTFFLGEVYFAIGHCRLHAGQIVASRARCRAQITILDDSLPWIHTLAILCQLSSLGLLNLNVILAPLFCLTHSLGLPVLDGLGSSSFTLVFLREFFRLFLEQSLLKRLHILLSNSHHF